MKASILCFYWRIFKYSQIRFPIWILAAIVACWYIAAVRVRLEAEYVNRSLLTILTKTLVGIFECHPVSGFWERFSPTHPTTPNCPVDSNKYFDGNAIPNIITDAAILVLPLPFIWTLQLRRAQKVALTGIFTLGLL